MSNLNAITNNAVRQAVGTMALNAGVIAQDAVLSDVQTTAAVSHIINGKFQTDFAAAAAIDLSAANYVDADGNTLTGPVTMPALAAGSDSRTKVYILAAIGTTMYVIEPEVNVAAAQDNAEESLHVPNGYCPFATIKVQQTPTDAAGSAAFTLGTTNLSGVANQTVTLGDIALVPPTVADVA